MTRQGFRGAVAGEGSDRVDTETLFCIVSRAGIRVRVSESE